MKYIDWKDEGMYNKEKLEILLDDYKKHFMERWENEKFKWEAVKRFQDNWNIEAEDFSKMFLDSTDKMYSLLDSMNNFPRGMIKAFADIDPNAVREMFRDLFDESKNLEERIERFRDKSEELRVKYDDGTFKNHYQRENAITVYLWLKYPDKYYIYKYSETKAFAKAIESDFVPKKGGSTYNVEQSMKLYNEVRKIVKNDGELNKILESAITESCYNDPERNTLITDMGFFTNKYYQNNNDSLDDKWFPEDYSPNLSVEEWMELLKDDSIFSNNNLQIMKRMADYGGQATCTQLSEKYGETKNFYNIGSWTLGKKIHEKTGCPLLEDNNENSKYWTVLYVGKHANKDSNGSYIWKLRDELKEAIDNTDLSEVSLYAINQEVDNEIEAYTKEDFLNQVYMSEENYESLTTALKYKKNIILQGAPGVGKTYSAKRLAYSIMGEKDNSRIEFVQFHQNYSYEDFIMGYKPKEEGYKLTNGIFYDFCINATNHPDKEYFFIIDEINRGNMSKIFGELLMLIEKDYRNTKATLAYSGTSFMVPSNIYIIGMMNTADRSLAMIDYALRRRFSFFEMEPGFNTDGFKLYQKTLNNETFNALIDVIIELNRAITKDESLGTGFLIGHSYFCNQQICTDEWMKAIVYYEIIPMLKEYWFDDNDKVQYWDNKLSGVFND